MRRENLNTVTHAARMGSGSRATTRKVDHSTIFPKADLDAGRNDSPKGVPLIQPYGFAYWPAKQDEEEQQEGQQQQKQPTDGGGGMGDMAGPGAFEEEDQPKGKSAMGLTSYANGSRSDPSVQNLQDPRHQLMLENEKEEEQQKEQQTAAGGGGGAGIGLLAAGEGAGGGAAGGGGQQKEDHGGREGDVAMYHMADKAIQFHFAGGDGKDLKPGAYLSTRADKNKIRLQLVDMDEGGQQQQQGKGQQKKYGQRPLLKKKSNTFIDIDGGENTITIKHGNSVVKLTGSKVIAYVGDESKSMVVDNSHTHIRCGNNRIWVDQAGCWSTVPIQEKQDDKD